MYTTVLKYVSAKHVLGIIKYDVPDKSRHNLPESNQMQITLEHSSGPEVMESSLL